MTASVNKPATYQDVIDAPENMVAEILNGELHLTPRPQYSHASVASFAGADVLTRFGRKRGGSPGGWVIVDEPELHLGDPVPNTTVVVPDIGGWRRDRFERPTGGGHTQAPDWACEVLSPGARNVRRDRLIKADIYHRAGVPWFWIVDPGARSVEVFRWEEEGYLRVGAFAEDVTVVIPPFEEEAIDLSAWWADLE